MEVSRLASEEDEERIHGSAVDLENAIAALLEPSFDPEKQKTANEWISQFVVVPFAWTVALYLAFPPTFSDVGRSSEVRFFALNLLLRKIRTDWTQLAGSDAQEIYDTLARQLPLNLDNRTVCLRLCVVVSAAAGLAGADACYGLISNIVGTTPSLEGPLAIELLIALAEETLLRARTLPPEVGQCIQDCSAGVLQYLQRTVICTQNADQLARTFICVERWISSGFTLSELFSDHPYLYKALLEALGSEDEMCFEAATTTLTELIAAVDLLPSREAAIRTAMSAILAQRSVYLQAAWDSVEESPNLKIKARGLVMLISVLGKAESSLLAQGGLEAKFLLDWIVDASQGGGGLGLKGATLAVDVWPILSRVPVLKRADILQPSLFAAAAKAIVSSAEYPTSCDNWIDGDLEEEELTRFRENVAEEALAAIYKELGSTFLGYILQQLHQAATWQSTEVCLFAAASLCREINAIPGLSSIETPVCEKVLAATSFLTTLFGHLFGPSDARYLPHWRLLQSTMTMIERYAVWIATQVNLLEAGVKYTLSALYTSKARGKSAKALRELCRNAAQNMVAAQALAGLIGAFDQALLTSSEDIGRSSVIRDRLAIVGGLSAVAVALPAKEAAEALTSLCSKTVSTIKAVADGQECFDNSGQVLAAALKFLTTVVTYASQYEGDPNLHPMLPILGDVWAPLDTVAIHWAADADVAAALCELWGIIATKVGVMLGGILPRVIVFAATMFKQHIVASCIDCIAEVVTLSPLQTHGSNIDEYLAAALAEVMDKINSTESILDNGPMQSSVRNLSYKRNANAVFNEISAEENGLSVLRSICALGNSFLRGNPSLLLHSASFSKIFHCAIGCIRRADAMCAIAGARFLSEAIACRSMAENDNVCKSLSWELPSSLVPYVDAVVGLSGDLVVKEVLETIAHTTFGPSLVRSLADVLYSLCLRYPSATKTALLSTISAKEFPARPGALSEFGKQSFVVGCTKQPPHPRARFKEMVSEFSQVCQALMPEELLAAY